MKTIILILLSYITINAQIGLLTLFSGDDLQPGTKAYKTLIDSVSGSISSADLNAIDVFVKETSSIRSKIVRFNPFAGDNLTTALVPLFRGTATGQVIGNAIDANTNFVAGDYSRAGGLGDASNATKYLNTGVNPSSTTALSLTNSGLSFWSLTDAQATGTSIGGYVSAGGDKRYFLIIRNASNQTYNGVKNSSGQISTTTDSRGLFTGVRDSDTSKTYYNGVRLSSPSSLTPIATEVNSSVFVFARATASSVTAGTYVPYKSSGYCIHQALTASEVLILYNAWNKLKTAFGR